ncbi:MAG: GNAT family N-acetyltransferase [Microcystaceae cyanobacterium]
MVFWKRLFNSTELAPSPSSTPFDGEFIDVTNTVAETNRILLSTDRNIDLYELEELCDAVGWARRPLRKVKKAIEHSFLVVSVWEVRGTRRRLMGFARATSDHAFNATIWDVVIHPKYQKQGVGKALMKYMIRKLKSNDISNVTLFADPQVVEFYRRLGFVLDPEGIKGMFLYPE